MRRCERPPAPTWFVERSASWTDRWLTTGTFEWPTLERERVNLRLLDEALLPMTAGHCAYCDAAPLGAASRATVDHHLPKSVHPELAFTFTNLFAACDVCQQAKADRVERDALRPDALGYRFEDWFIFKPENGEIAARLDATPEGRLRAEATIRWFELNRHGRPGARRRIWRQRRSEREPGPLDEYSYRFVWDAEG